MAENANETDDYIFTTSEAEAPFAGEPEDVEVSGPRAEVVDLFKPSPKVG